MSETVTPKRFHEAEWRVVRDDASTHFRTGSFAAGVALVNAIGRLADDANHHADVDLRPVGVTVRLRTEGVGGLSERVVVLARQISDAARELGVPVDLTGLQIVQVAIDALVIPDVLPFWRAVLGYREVDDEDLIDPHFQGPPIWFQQMDAPRPQRNRIHIDVYVPTIRRRLASRRRLPPVATWSATRTRRDGGPWPTPKATRSTSLVGRIATDRDLGSYAGLAIAARKWALSCNVISGAGGFEPPTSAL
jgi:4a-hydroxytetrahydrobiopterin dehydratase